MPIAIRVENLSKQYRLGQIGTGSISHDVNRWWHTVRGKEDPYLKIGETNDRTKVGNSEYVWSLKDINFSIEQGDAVGIIGRNGAGKSTLLKILSRVTSPTTGKVKARGRIASLLEVGTGFHPELSGRENIFLNGAILGMRKYEIEKKFDEIVDFAGVERYIDTPVKRYSSGMYVRLAFAVAAYLESEILIVDEVLAVGDAEFQKKCLGKMGEVSKGEGRTVLFVSHNMTSIAYLCNKAIVLEHGKMQHSGDLNEGINIYLNSNKDNISTDGLKKFLSSQNDKVFHLLNFELKQEGQVNNQFVSNKKIEIIINYQIKREVLGLRIGFDLIEKQNNIIIFRSFHDDSLEEIQNFPPGIYESRLYIDSNLLKEGAFIIDLAVGIHNIRWIISDTVKVKLNILNINGINRIYADTRPGIILPKLEWTTIQVKY